MYHAYSLQNEYFFQYVSGKAVSMIMNWIYKRDGYLVFTSCIVS